nr:GAF domain-containing protein [uncultured Dyadobacter sp.]
MKPLNLLVVAIRNEWLGLLEDSLSYAGYQFRIKQANSKQSAIKAFHEAKYDLLISNCILPDGKITDLANVLGSQLPCLVMTEGHCPVTAERVLAVTETNYYINCSNKLGWIPALENTLSKWEDNAKQKLDQHIQNHDNLYKKVLARCNELLSGQKKANQAISEVFHLLIEVMDLSRAYLCLKSARHGEPFITRQTEAVAPGVTLKQARTEDPAEIPYLKRWAPLFEAGRTVAELNNLLPTLEQQLFTRRDIQSLLAVPIHVGGNWIGYIAIEDALNPREWTEAEEALMRSVADLIQKKHFTTVPSSRHNSELLTSPA